MYRSTWTCHCNGNEWMSTMQGLPGPEGIPGLDGDIGYPVSDMENKLLICNSS